MRSKVSDWYRSSPGHEARHQLVSDLALGHVWCCDVETGKELTMAAKMRLEEALERPLVVVDRGQRVDPSTIRLGVDPLGSHRCHGSYRPRHPK